MHPYLEHDGPIPIVHRGAPLARDAADVTVVENTNAAFRRAYDRGFRYLETDVRATADGVLVACHDASLIRVGGVRINVHEVTWAELSKVSIGRERLPRLVDLLNDYPDARFNIDAKTDTAVRPLVKALLAPGVLERSCVASFSDRRLGWVRTALGSRVCTAAGPRELALAILQIGRRRDLCLPNVDVLQVPRWLPSLAAAPGRLRIDLVETAQRVGLPIHVWTVNDVAEVKQLLARGVGGVMSDDTDVLTEGFAGYGEWTGA